MLPRGRNEFQYLRAEAAGLTNHLHVAFLPAGGRDSGRLEDVYMFLCVRHRQRQQRQTHERRQHDREDSYSALFHGTKPHVLRLFANNRNFFDSLAKSIIS